MLLAACTANGEPPAEAGSGGDVSTAGGGDGATAGAAGGAGGDGGGGEGGGDGEGGAGPECDGAPVTLTGDVLDPGQVYLDGTLEEGACYMSAVAHWSTPSSAVVGFPCHFDGRNAQIRPTDGRLIYLDSEDDVLLEFRCEGCPYDGGEYPLGPRANDPVLPTPPCEEDILAYTHFLISPEGAVLHRCRVDAPTWYDPSGNEVYADPDSPLLHLGHGGLALTERSVVDLATSASTPIVGLPERKVHTVRAKAPDRFLVVIDEEADRPPEESRQELWEVDGTGTATRLGAFPPLPAGVLSVYAIGAKLDACGGLLQIGEADDDSSDVIVRREIGGASEVVYTEATEPLVRMHGASLITGP
ncbi:hypothetical protein BE21_42995 [Sorangium cellulosum]|uniref:Uncharacterized protein n=1 Tax=Sorangium cellulosum TaxID=56 RepID=A0A150TK47_SORCE|nr:hypothetical protein BE21_42995 [Sorangium cellulosum]